MLSMGSTVANKVRQSITLSADLFWSAEPCYFVIGPWPTFRLRVHIQRQVFVSIQVITISFYGLNVNFNHKDTELRLKVS